MDRTTRARMSRMPGPSDDRRLLTSACVLAAAVAVTAGCSYGRIVTTDDGAAPTQLSAPAPPASSIRPTNDHLANAFDFYAQPDGRTGYYFTTPSKRWVCAIIPREQAGCQSSAQSAIPIAGAPDSVLNAVGEDVAPNAILVDRDTDARFARLDPPGYALTPGPAVVLPFGKVLIVAGFQCNVQETTGISCRSEHSGKGFTFSADGYTTGYTDPPA